MASTATVPLVDGPADGQMITVELDMSGRPPLTHHHIRDEGLTGADIYELEAVAGNDAARWLYRWRPMAL
jgi:hypothetical protein